LDTIKKELDEERKKVEEIMKGNIPTEIKDLIKMVLFIVESPNKARTIANFFGKPSVRRIGNIKAYETTTGKYILTIVATKGHLFELTLKEEGVYGVLKEKEYVPIFSPIKKCLDCGHQFVDEDKCPRCGSENIDDASDRIKVLRDLAQEADIVLIGTDPDAEGEKIAYDVYSIIRPYNKNIYRAEFHEVTRQAIIKALEEIRDINTNRVKAQLVRRIEDRWIGFALSQRLWSRFKKKTLSAGRVQTPVLGFIIKRYEEYKKNRAHYYAVKTSDFEVTFISDDPLEKYDKTIKIEKIEEKESEKKPLPPYTTDSLLRDAVIELRLSVDKIMALAQNLFEWGLITYHRTDSTHISNLGIQIAQTYIENTFGKEYFYPRHWGEEGTHEAIRPTKPIDTETLIKMLREGDIQIQGITKEHIRLYDLIFRRFIASQMKPFIAIETKFNAVWSNLNTTIEGITDIKENGWNLIKPIKLLAIKEGEYEVIDVKHWIGSKVPLYTQADVIELMKEQNIGRPSTYATIVKKLFERYYVIEKNQRLIPTERGIKVYQYLTERFGHLVDVKLTADLLEKMDRIENGELDYMDVLRSFKKELIEIWKTKETKYIADGIYKWKEYSVPAIVYERYEKILKRKKVYPEYLTPWSRAIYNALPLDNEIEKQTLALAIEKDFEILTKKPILREYKKKYEHLKNLVDQLL